TTHPRPNAEVEKSFHDDLTGERTGERGVLPRGEQGQGKCRARPGAEQRRQQLVRILDLGHLRVASAMKRRRGSDENCRIDEEGEAERNRGIDEGERYRLAPTGCRLLVLSR